MLLHMRRYDRFYQWFYSSGIGLASKRGLGAHPSKLYGIFTSPTLTPLQLRWTGWAFTGCLVGACTPLAPRVFLFVAFLLYFFYFTQLYADATLSAHLAGTSRVHANCINRAQSTRWPRPGVTCPPSPCAQVDRGQVHRVR